MAGSTHDSSDSRVKIEDQALTPAIAASWERCQKYGLRRQNRALFGDSLSRTRSRRVAEENVELIDKATPEMRRLYGSLGSARWLALCVNPRGEIVQSVGAHASAPRELQVLMHPGRLLTEAELGTTAPGCVLEDPKAIIVNRGEHFLHELEHFFCASAPILRPDGMLAGVMDISGVDVEVLPLAHDMVSLAVRGIENSMLEALSDCVLLRFHCDERLLGTPFEGILAVGPDGSVAGANRVATRLLALGDAFGIGTPLESIFDHGLEGILRRVSLQHSPRIRLRSHLGSVAYLDVAKPRVTRPKPHGTASPASAGGIRDSAIADQFVVLDRRLLTDYSRAVRVLAQGVPMLIEGDTGTGKEVFARALHRATRPDGPFLAVNCAAIPEGLIEAELFGYANGAFTGARRGGAAGKIEQAHQGVLFLDEVGDMPQAMQMRLLRVLQERSVVRIGDSRELPVDLLVICATNRRLAELVERGQFRLDLYHRISGHTLSLPPLRERQDVAEIIEALVRRRSASAGLNAASEELGKLISPAAMQCLRNYAWPGNIRELEHVIYACVALRGPENPIDISDLPEHVAACAGCARRGATAPGEATPLLREAEAAAIRKALKDHGGNVTVAARTLGISRSTLYSKLKRLGLD
jgi:transcriptional regulator of acetoin/glycerol metabolism